MSKIDQIVRTVGGLVIVSGVIIAPAIIVKDNINNPIVRVGTYISLVGIGLHSLYKILSEK